MRRISYYMHSRFVYPAVVLLCGEHMVFGPLRRLRLLEQFPASEVRRRQDQKLADALAYAYEHCQYYRDSWAGAPDRGEPRAFLERLAPLEKVDLQRQAERLQAVPRPWRVTHKTTGGSTGKAVTIVKDSRALAHEMAASWLGYGWFGIGIGDRGVRFWGQPRSTRRRLRFLAADLATNRIRLSAFAFSAADLARYWDRCLSFRPDYVYGYVSMLTTFAEFLRANGYCGHRLRLRAVITTAEVLTEPQRSLLAETFGCLVQNEYGCGEVGPIAYGCERGLLHVMSDNVVAEVRTSDGRPAAAGESGELLITDLNNRAMPLIRYRVGDLAEVGDDCGCGRPFPVLQRVWGRAYDFVRSPDGRQFHGEFFMYLFEDLKQQGLGVEQFQVTQTGTSELRVDVVSHAEPTPGQVDAISSRIREAMPSVSVSVNRVPEIRRAPSGKTRVIVNALAESR